MESESHVEKFVREHGIKEIWTEDCILAIHGRDDVFGEWVTAPSERTPERIAYLRSI